MPLYEYRCTTCHEPREFTVPMQDRDHQDCAQCGDRLVRRHATPYVAAIAGIPNKIGAEIEGRDHYA